MTFPSSSCHSSSPLPPNSKPIGGCARMIIDDWGESERCVRIEEVSVNHRFNEGRANTREGRAAREKRGRTKKKERLLEVYRGLTELQNITSGFLTLINVPKKVIICTFLVT